jgi:hypothetical protein
VVDPVKCDVVIAVQKIGVVEMNESIVKQRVAVFVSQYPGQPSTAMNAAGKKRENLPSMLGQI